MGPAKVSAADESRVPEICYAVARLERAVNVAIAKQLAPHGLTTLQYTILSVLERHGTPLSNAQLARRAYMRPQSMAEVLDALESKGLIRREAHPNHGRLLPARVTAKGCRVLSACDAVVIGIEEKMFEAYSPARRKTFVAMARAGLISVRSNFLSDGLPVLLNDAGGDRATSPKRNWALTS